MAHSRVTLTAAFTRLDGTPAEGTATVIPSRRHITDQDGHSILSGKQTFQLTAGVLEVDLPATDDPRLGEPFTYDVTVAMHHAHWSTRALTLPAAAGTVDLADVPAAQVAEYLRRDEVEALIVDALADIPAVTVSDTAPDRGLWINPNVEA